MDRVSEAKVSDEALLEVLVQIREGIKGLNSQMVIIKTLLEGNVSPTTEEDEPWFDEEGEPTSESYHPMLDDLTRRERSALGFLEENPEGITVQDLASHQNITYSAAYKRLEGMKDKQVIRDEFEEVGYKKLYKMIENLKH